ncbi:MAG TPA: hypothetical protein VLZ81_06145, partial [Blastocatellia bacterium]|nr:hypothetical protein [Blastocatellia bacterium]
APMGEAKKLGMLRKARLFNTLVEVSAATEGEGVNGMRKMTELSPGASLRLGERLLSGPS